MPSGCYKCGDYNSSSMCDDCYQYYCCCEICGCLCCECDEKEDYEYIIQKNTQLYIFEDLSDTFFPELVKC